MNADLIKTGTRNKEKPVGIFRAINKVFFSAKGAKCESLGQRPRSAAKNLGSAEGAK